MLYGPRPGGETRSDTRQRIGLIDPNADPRAVRYEGRAVRPPEAVECVLSARTVPYARYHARDL